MEDRKNIVIKVKYPTSGKSSVDDNKSKMVEQWDVKRIGMASAGLVLFFLVIILIFSEGDESLPNKVAETVNSEASVQAQQEAADPTGARSQEKATQPVVKLIDYSKSVLRSTLTFAIKNSEPHGKVTSPLHLSKTKPVSVFYFAELNDLKGRAVYIEWLLEGELITRKKVNISGDHWRMTSRQYLNYSTKTNWLVRMVDDRGQVITQIPFDTIYR